MTVNLTNQKVLLIEDYSTMRNSIKEMLYRGGNAKYIHDVENAKAALQSMGREHFNIVLCDYNLGVGQTGQQLLEEAKSRKLLASNSIFIMVTAEQSPNMVLSAMDCKPDDYLVKPFNTQQLITRLEKQLQRKAYFSNIDRAIEKDDLAQAIAHCEHLLNQQDPKMRSQLLKIRAELSIDTGDFSGAEQCYQEILLQRDLAWAKHGLGVIAFLKNQFDDAIDLFNEVIAQAPMMLESYDWLCKTYEAVEKLREAENSIQYAVELAPSAIQRQQKLAGLAEELSHHETAIKAYKAAIRIGQFSIYKSSRDFSGLAKVYCKCDNYTEAFKVIKQMDIAYQHNVESQLRAACLQSEIYFKQDNLPASEAAYKPIKPVTQLSNHIPKDLALDIAQTHYLLGDKSACNVLLDNLINNYADDERFMKELVHRHQAFSEDEYYAYQCFMQIKLEMLDTVNKSLNLFKQGDAEGAKVLLENAHNKAPHNKFFLTNLIHVLLQDIKASGFTNEKYLVISHFLIKAQSIGVVDNKVGKVKMELARLMAQNVPMQKAMVV